MMSCGIGCANAPLVRPRDNRTARAAADTTLRQAAALDLDYHPPVLSNVLKGGLYVIRGPRRVGKSVALKRFVLELLGRPDVLPTQVIYLSLDEFDQRTLRRALNLARELTAAPGEAPRYWLIDEVTAVPGWPAAIKSARDDTPFGFDTVVLTGSSAHGLDEARRALGAGRVGPASDPFRLLLPMSFRDFVQATERDIPDSPPVGPSLSQSQEVTRTLANLTYLVDDVDLAWQAYCEVGGFPRAVAEYRRDGHVSSAFSSDIANWLAPDVTPGDPPESVFRLLSALGTRMASPLNVRRTAAEIGMTRERLVTRLNRLRATFATFVCPQVDESGSAGAGSAAEGVPARSTALPAAEPGRRWTRLAGNEPDQ